MFARATCANRVLGRVAIVGSSDPGEFGRRLRQLRESAALSQEELAERANLSAKAIGALERGERRRPYPNTVRALASGLDLNEDGSKVLTDALRPGNAIPDDAPAALATLPAPPTPMLGRESELAQVLELLGSPGLRMLTLTGPGGVGKTRLALEVARTLQAERREIVLVELAEVRRVDLVVPTIARAFGVRAGSDDLIAAIAVHVAGSEPILVLDNVEHVMAAATDVADLVGRCPELVVLATSRAPLRVRAEHEVPLDPLGVPTIGGDAAAVAGSAAARMFVDRARSVTPGFVVDRSNAAAVATICRRLDGLPLALELAAAHLQYLGPSQLLDRLDHALDSARLRDLPERQRTMRATLDWSHDLLTGDEQVVLRSLSVFAGGFDLDAAEHVAGAPGLDVLTALEGLIEQSLVLAPQEGHPDGNSRFKMLEPVRDDASARMSTTEASALAERHADHFARLCAEAHVGLRSMDQKTWLDRLATEHANLRAALETLLERDDLDAAALLGEHTWMYWALRGHAGEGLLWWQAVLDQNAGRLDDRARAAAHQTLAGLRFATGDLDGVRTQSAPAVEIARTLQDTRLLHEALVLACMGATFSGDLDVATGLLDELFGVIDHVEGEWARAHVLICEAQLSVMRADLDGSAAALHRADALARNGAGPFTLATVLNMQTTLALANGDDETALSCAAEAAQIAADVGTTWTLVYTLPALATLAARRGHPETAAALFAAGAATAETSLLAVAFRPDLDAAEAHLGDVRAQLAGEEFERAWQRGRRLGLAEVIELIPLISAPAPS